MATRNQPSYGPSTLRPRLTRLWNTINRPFELIGHQVSFVLAVIRGLPHTLRSYRAQTMSSFAETTWGRGSLLVGGGIAGVFAVLGISVGGMIGILGVTTLQSLDLTPLTGLLTANGATRELVPMIAAVGFAAQAGCRMTAEIGSMRINEEIDALEAQALAPIPFVVGTRVVAGLLAVVPFYLLSLCLAFVTARVVVSTLYGQSGGAYDHYFESFLSGGDVLFSTVKVIVLVTVLVINHCYYGFNATGGPEGVGVAAGRAIRASLVLIVTLDMVMSLAYWGLTAAVDFS